MLWEIHIWGDPAGKGSCAGHYINYILQRREKECERKEGESE